MFQDAFYKLDAKDSKAVLREANPHFQNAQFDAGTATLLAYDLNFYPDYKLIDIADYKSVPAVRRHLLYKEGNCLVLNWTNEPIYRLNKQAPLVLTADTVADYVRFYFTTVRGRHGRFSLSSRLTIFHGTKTRRPPRARRSAA